MNANRLRKRTRYTGHAYPNKTVEFTGAEWQQVIAVEGLTVRTVPDDPGCLHLHHGAELQYEVYGGTP